LVVCPASLQSQWASEISRFCDRNHRIVLGSSADRVSQYTDETFFKIANYEQIVRDEAIVQQIDWDLIILDEGQRIKNWETKTSQTFQMLKSRYALVLSGTPLENRLDELFTVTKFIDGQRLGPAYRFFHRHRVIDENGRIKGYKKLDELRETLRPILLRRTRASVMMELPERTTEVVRIRPTDEQKTLSDEHLSVAAMIASKPYITEMDLLRLQKHLLAARMVCDSTFLLTKEDPSYSSKLDVLNELLEELAEDKT
jgi:SNF2 family DNA or RNA helicase